MTFSRVGQSEDEFRDNSIEQFEKEHKLYLEKLVCHYVEHMEWYALGFVGDQNFMPKIAEDVYNNNLYYMSWFYHRLFPFNN